MGATELHWEMLEVVYFALKLLRMFCIQVQVLNTILFMFCCLFLIVVDSRIILNISTKHLKQLTCKLKQPKKNKTFQQIKYFF